LLLSFSLSAQQVQIIDTPPAGTVTPDHAFGALDFTAVTSGFLAEKGMPLAKLSRYNGSDSVFVNKHSLDRICATLAGATVGYSAPNVVGIVEPASATDTIPFNLLLFDYHSLAPNALNNGLLSINNGQLQHVSGAGSPYVANRLFAAAPSVSRELPAGNYHFRIDLHAGASMPILSTKVDFGDGGGLQAVQDGDLVSVQYTSGGAFEITSELTLWNRVKLVSKSLVSVAAPAGSAAPVGSETYCTNNDFSFTVNTTENGTVHTATVTGRSACCDTEIRKPFIVINGFETPALEEFFGFTLLGLLDNLRFTGTPTSNSLIDDLESSNYDILFIDFADETEALEINARLVDEAIREINARKHQAGSSEQNVVVGISMGGVVGKLGLLDMEAAGEQHESAVFFSMDSPLRGANIPLGAQFAVDHLESVRVEGSVIVGYTAPGPYATWGAVHVSNVGEYIMSGGELSNNDVGLYCPPGKYVNVTLRGQAEVADNDFYGLHIVEGNREGSNYGLVTMDCARLLNKGLAGIKGQNLILNIDAFINPQTDNLAYARANHFQRGPNDALWFDICYDGVPGNGAKINIPIV
jgi:hypothetical protein